MAYISVQEASSRYSKSEKTIRRLYEGKTPARAQAYQNKKKQWRINSDWLDSLYSNNSGQSNLPESEFLEQTKPPVTSQNDDQVLGILKDTLEALKGQLKAKDDQLKLLDEKLDQQQKLSLGLQNQLQQLNETMLLQSPQKPVDNLSRTNTPSKPKNSPKRPQNKPKAKTKATKPAAPQESPKKPWWRRK
jgi:hypothetical protein